MDKNDKTSKAPSSTKTMLSKLSTSAVPKKSLQEYMAEGKNKEQAKTIMVNTMNRAYVPQGHVAMYSYQPKEKIQYLTSSGISTCVGLIMWSERSKTGLLAHLDSDSRNKDDTKSYVKALLSKLCPEGVERNDLFITVVHSGHRSPGRKEGHLTRLNEAVTEALNSLVGEEEWCWFEDSPDGADVDIAFNLNTGIVSQYELINGKEDLDIIKSPTEALNQAKSNLVFKNSLHLYKLEKGALELISDSPQNQLANTSELTSESSNKPSNMGM